MAGLAQLALGTAPVVGGALLAVGAGQRSPKTVVQQHLS